MEEEEEERTFPMNRSELYTAIAKEVVGKLDVQKVKAQLMKRYRTDRYDRMDLNQLEDFLNFLKAGVK